MKSTFRSGTPGRKSAGRPLSRSTRCRLEPLEARLVLSGLDCPVAVCGADPRDVTSLDATWRFNRSDVPGAQNVNFDDSSWDTVSLPHTWNNLDGQQGGSYYRGIGWYRQHYTVPADQAGKELFIKFDGASLVTDLYVNGQFVGEHQGGFAAFVWDLTSYLTVGADNVLAVKVNNANNPNIPPTAGDFTVDGGIYRHVNLIATDPLHVSLTDFASPGVYLQQTNVSPSSADVQITTKLRNDGSATRQVMVQSLVVDAAGTVVTTLQSSLTLAAHGAMDVVQNTTLTDPHLWDGRADPYLYHVCVQVIDPTTGTTTDLVQQPLGLRFYRIDPANGYFLNGHYLDLHGVDFHQDRINQGWAISDSDQQQDISLIQEIGATFVRLSHYQHPPLTYDLLDQAGIIAWSEIPVVASVTNSQAFTNNAKQQLQEMIRQNYNHPAVIVWGMYNEIGDNPTTQSLVRQLVQLAHTEDPTRPTTAATNQANNATINYIPDVIGFNKYYGWYYGSPTDLGPSVDGIHAQYPNQAIGLSEYGAGASIYQHEVNAPEPPSGGPWHPEEYQASFHETDWLQLKTRPYLWAKTIWNMFDFASASRNEGDTPGRNDKGLMTYDRQTRKDAFYWYKANWSSDPVLYLTDRHFLNRPTSGPVTVKVYSNLPAVQLVVNGVSLGTMTNTNDLFQWSNVALGAGTNTVVVRASQGPTTYTDTVTWYTPRSLLGVPFASINFQPAGVSVPPGYQPDYGSVYANRGNGLTYGWDVDNSANTRVRHVNPDPRYDTLIHLQKTPGGRVWEIAVPNGKYDVHLVSGDPSFTDGIYLLNVEGVLAVSGGVKTSSQFQEAWREVRVTDGLLTITNAAGASNNKISFIEINQVEVFSGPPMPSPLGTAQPVTAHVFGMATPDLAGLQPGAPLLPAGGQDSLDAAVLPPALPDQAATWPTEPPVASPALAREASPAPPEGADPALWPAPPGGTDDWFASLALGSAEASVG